MITSYNKIYISFFADIIIIIIYLINTIKTELSAVIIIISTL